MVDKIHINSHKGEYSVSFNKEGINDLNHEPPNNAVFIIDKRIAQIYSSSLCNIIENERYLLIEALEENKSLDKFPDYIKSLVDLGLKRDERLVAIGGGIIQDITCFLASTMMRGIPWLFYPSTLLAMSDSCIGSKSSVNSKELKNILGTFNPPKEIILDVTFLDTLDQSDIFSGIGEMLKVHAIDAPESFERIATNYQEILDDREAMEHFIKESLRMKKKLIEIDEFDQGPRNVMNYGHSFGHAIESATNYKIPHGIAVTIGMDVANFVATKLNITEEMHFDRMHDVLDRNCHLYRKENIDVSLLIEALSKDKKNTKSKLRLILPNKNGEIEIGLYEKSPELERAIFNYFNQYH